MQSRRLCLAWLLIGLACFAASASAQTSTVISQADGSVTIDAARLTTIVTLDAPWRFSPTDAPHFADPDFDDSAWTLIKAGSTLLAANAPGILHGESWARLRLHLLSTNSKLAISLEARGDTQFVVFVDGKEIATSPGFATHTSYLSRPFVITLPLKSNSVLAIHFLSLGYGPIQYFPLKQISLGQGEAIGAATDLQRFRDFDNQWLTDVLTALMYLALVPVALTLFWAQPSHREYLWLALRWLSHTLAALAFWGTYSGILPGGDWVIELERCVAALGGILYFQFLAALAAFRYTWVLRVGQLLLLVPTVVGLFGLNAPAYFLAYRIIDIPTVILILAILIVGYRNGKKECGFLLTASLVGTILDQASSFAGITELQSTWSVGGVGLHVYDAENIFALFGLVAVVLYRFIRVSKDEEAAASELEAARTVQQLLIPSQQPATPGFLIESVYLPARQVGGDFFLILPAQDPTSDLSLLAVIGDVSGKGLQAAMVVSTIIGGLRMQLSRQPAEVLAHLNRALTGHVSGFATCCAVLIHQDGRALIANAGNPSPYLHGEELPTSPGLPLGLTSNIAYDETAFTLAPGARLTFVSDGVVEATSFPRKELFGFDRTRAISTQSAAAIAEAACAFGTGAPQADDITVLTIAFTAP